MTSPAAFVRHLSKFEKRPKMPHPNGFVCIKSNAVSKASSNFSSEEYRNIGNVFELSGVAFCLALPYTGLLVPLISLGCEW